MIHTQLFKSMKTRRKKMFDQALSAEDEVVVISIIPEFIQGETCKLYPFTSHNKALKVVSINNDKDTAKIVAKFVPG